MVEKCIRDFLMLWATIDPIGTMALFLAVTASATPRERAGIAFRATLYSAIILTGAVVVGQFVLEAMEISLASLEIAGGMILFLFGVQMVFGTEAKPPADDPHHDPAIFPMAIPSIAGPGAIMAAILLTDNDKFSIPEQMLTGTILIIVLVATYLLMRFGEIFLRILGKNGAAVLVRIMGMLLAALAVEMAIEGISRQIAMHTGAV